MNEVTATIQDNINDPGTKHNLAKDSTVEVVLKNGARLRIELGEDEENCITIHLSSFEFDLIVKPVSSNVVYIGTVEH
jgi:hypothetical protein